MNLTHDLEQAVADVRLLVASVQRSLDLRGVAIRPRVETEETILEWWHTHPEQVRRAL